MFFHDYLNLFLSTFLHLGTPTMGQPRLRHVFRFIHRIETIIECLAALVVGLYPCIIQPLITPAFKSVFLLWQLSDCTSFYAVNHTHLYVIGPQANVSPQFRPIRLIDRLGPTHPSFSFILLHVVKQLCLRFVESFQL